MHNGSFYLDIQPFTFLQAISELIDEDKMQRNNICIKFIGKNDDTVIAELNSLKIADIIEQHNYLPHNQSLIHIINANLLLLISGNSIKCKAHCPGKIFEYIRTRNRILALTPGKGVINSIIERTKSGQTIKFDDISAIKIEILKEYNRWEKHLPPQRKSENFNVYERRNITQNLASILNEISRITLHDN